ncbi:MAG: DnaJ domain-containing protein [Clostridia bacterium]|nr:DnaJ domain-containing protein [Clostridia bacterium]
MSRDPYEVLGVKPTATDDEVKTAYRNMARKYHPDNYADNPLSDLAQEKMQEINEAYDAIVRMRKNGGSAGTGGYGGAHNGGYRAPNGGPSRYGDIRQMIQQNRVMDAEMLLDGVPAYARDAEWFFLKGSVLYKKGWLEDAFTHFQTACRMDPNNLEYRQAYNRVANNRQTGGYRTVEGGQGCTGCDVCTTLYCADCCCECMGGDLLRCC